MAEDLPLRILLAEDGVMNQKLAVALLSKWGHQVTVASDGRKAVHAFEHEPFDLVLMDLQMPEMDGFEATACIRELQKVSKHRVPIIAMTARAMKGDRELCLASGMDGYVSKPIRQRDLYQAIAEFFPATPVVAAAVPLIGDWQGVLGRVENDRQVLSDVIDCFLLESPRFIAELDRGCQAGDAPVVYRAAHTLKSNLQFFGVVPLMELAKKIEEMGRTGQLQGASTLVADLKSKLTILFSELGEYRASIASSG